MRSQSQSNVRRSSLLAGAALACVLGTAANGTAQPLKEVKTPDTPLVLKAQGSFFVGGEKVEQTQVELGDLGPGGHITVNQMYVRYMVPQGGDGNVPVVMVHGATLTGKSWETTPDGRMGWDEYFVRKGHPVYVPDQVGRGRSGFNQAVFNDVRAGSVPPANLPRWIRFSDEVVWPNFRFGSKPDAPYADSQFPLTAVDEMSKQGVPDVSFGGLPNPNPTFKALADLASQVNGAVLMGHSQSGAFPLAAALLNPSAVKGLILVEPGACPGNYTDEQIKTLATLPVLAVFGDHRDTPTGIGIRPSWQLSFEGCQALITRLKAAGGQAQMLSPAETGIRGNSHMIMQDKNNLQIADLILQWIDERVTKRTGATQVTRPKSRRAFSAITGAGIAIGAVALAVTATQPVAGQSGSRVALQLEDYAALPITADNTDQNTRAQLARVNYLRDEPGGRRFFVNDLNGPLYLLDKQTKAFTTYLDFNGLADRPGLFPKFTYARNFATGLTNVILDPDYASERRVLHPSHGGPLDAGIRGAAERGRARTRSVGIRDDAGRVDADRRWPG